MKRKIMEHEKIVSFYDVYFSLSEYFVTVNGNGY